MQAVDTTVLVRLLVGDDERQTRAAEAVVAASGQVWISHVVLVETVWVLESVYDRKREEIAAALETMLDHRSFVLQEPEVVREAFASFRRRKGAGFSDCLVLETASKATCRSVPSIAGWERSPAPTVSRGLGSAISRRGGS